MHIPRTQAEFDGLTSKEQLAAVESEIRRIGEKRGASTEDVNEVLSQKLDVLQFCGEGQQWELRDITINERFQDLTYRGVLDEDEGEDYDPLSL